ncbi:MAG: YggS family pyridoxal phosphate-dependent enzyme [Alphaproteobacteria bacterium]
MTESPDLAAIAARYQTVLSEIRAAEKAAGRAPGSVTLVAVSKTFGAEAIRPVLAAGQRVFGENRVQEAQGKWPALKAAYPSTELHLIGPLQTNKARDAVRLFDVIETLDRPKLAHALAAAIEKEGRSPRFLIEVNLGAEAQKSGVAPAALGALLALARELKLNVEGLMCIPPQDRSPASYFAELARLATKYNLSVLSMGMSADFKLAIAAGSTHVRVGSAIFGTRH